MIKILIFSIAFSLSCGNEPSGNQAPAPPPVVQQPPPTQPDECQSGFSVGFDQVKPIVTRKCVSCHPGFNSFATFKGKISEALRRFTLGSNDPRRMPPPPLDELNPQEKNTLESWRNDGLKENSSCKDNQQAGNYTLEMPYIRSYITKDLERLDADSRFQAAYLISSHNYNEALGSFPESLVNNAGNKGVNSISRSQNLRRLAAIDPKGTIFRIDLTAYGLNRNDWNLIVDNDRFRIIDNSTQGRVIRILTDKQQPWLHLDNFLNTALSPRVYNRLRRVPINASDLYNRLGVDLAQQYRDRTVRFLGFLNSPISNTNRRLRRYDTNVNDNGFLWVTNDTDDNDLPLIEQADLFRFPLSAETGGESIFEYKAEEWIYQLDNGLIGFALYDFPGQIRQEEAPSTIVRQNGPFQAEITNGRDCMRCHNKILPQTDTLRDSALSGNFGQNDIPLIRDFYQPKGVNDALFKRDNRAFGGALAKLGIDTEGPDPVNGLVDLHRQNYNLAKVAAFFFVTPDYMRERLSENRGILPQLLTQGQVTLDSLIIATPDIINILETFEDRD